MSISTASPARRVSRTSTVAVVTGDALNDPSGQPGQPAGRVVDEAEAVRAGLGEQEPRPGAGVVTRTKVWIVFPVLSRSFEFGKLGMGRHRSSRREADAVYEQALAVLDREA
jgi:hypothetical protein